MTKQDAHKFIRRQLEIGYDVHIHELGLTKPEYLERTHKAERCLGFANTTDLSHWTPLQLT